MLLAMATLYAPAQTNGSNSPYSRFGLGSLKDQSQGFNKAMSGVALGFRDGNRINMQNPASYSAIDSLSFIFDVGLTLQNVNFKSGGNSINAHNTTLDYINAGFRLCPGLGFSFGFIPFSSIGYDFSESKYLGDHFNSGSTMTYTNSYTGDGGLHEDGIRSQTFLSEPISDMYGETMPKISRRLFMKTEQPPAQATGYADK